MVILYRRRRVVALHVNVITEMSQDLRPKLGIAAYSMPGTRIADQVAVVVKLSSYYPIHRTPVPPFQLITQYH